MEEALDHVVYSRNVMEFVTVANEYCTLIESAPNYSRFEFVTIITRVLPLIYLKASLLPLVEQELDDSIEKSVDEMSYLLVREALNSKFGRFSDYLEVVITSYSIHYTKLYENSEPATCAEARQSILYSYRAANSVAGAKNTPQIR